MDGRVLIVADRGLRREVLKLLRQNGLFDFVGADNGRQALDRLSEREFDLIVMTWQDEESCGNHLFRELKSDAAYRQLPVILLRRNEPQQVREEQDREGVEHVLTLPLDYDQVRRVLLATGFVHNA